ncbi:hypothetical protein [Hymenobacter coccineus]|uniref:Uncharacterized protein n=1 Tax=Hymenobacter coccineus TaxID=1908235 RepID=A0A1G1TII1_9BACT|nr:hypothetical protein [Hymenobacter coccineus]OGX90680.1 hypothetical protein BEN49_22080 [Hymenobacter coccineus]
MQIALDSPTPTAAFDKARTGLWTSLQKHLATVYAAEAAYRQAVAFAPDVPFAAAAATADQLDAYGKQRSALRDLFADETTQLDQLTKAIRTKGYAADEKKQLYVLLLGYIDIAASVFALLDSHAPTTLAADDELAETKARFDRVKNFARLNVKGVAGLLVGL